MSVTPSLPLSESSLGMVSCIPAEHQAHCFCCKRYSPACTRLLSQYKTMLKLVGDDVPSIDEFMSRYKVCSRL